ncbi:ribonuclease R [Serpentinimonas barnesii]|uniref:ribonuclease R n=1 Tax=Serpentinimonas barnesii TaxID=1458427 RepID=UPI000AEEA3DF|nr:ribonuclease R [Serpentinimonas barnesii]
MKEKIQNPLLTEFDGVVNGHRDGHGFVQRDDGQPDLYLSPNEMRAVLHRDRVKARIIGHDRRGRPEGRVTEIIERSSAPLIGRLLHEGGIWLLAPEDKRYGQDVLIPKGATGAAQAGQVVVVELTEPPALFGQPVGRVKEVLGEIDDPGMEIEIAVRKYGVPHLFSDAALAQARGLPEHVRATDRKGRIDLTDIPLVTIDGEDARDFDDAVYCEPARVGRSKGWRLLVAIADVSHYVENGNALDADAYDRATSVYFPRRVIPMLPEKLSNGLCSLNPQVERLCLVCDMLINAQGEVHAYQFYPAVMFSHARLTYTEVAAILQNTRGPQAQQRAALVPHLLHLHEVYRGLLSARQRRGAVDFETVETQIVCDEVGRIEKIVPRVRTEAHKLIEETMLAANVCAAEFIAQGKQWGLYRVHEGPTPEKIETLRQYLKALGVTQSLPEQPQPKDFQQLAAATQERPDAAQIHQMLLRSMQQAIYTPHNSGHFGLAFEAYTHFTSPIRRYPDLLVHRLIKAILAERRYHLPTLPTPGEAQAKLSKRLAGKGAAADAGAAPQARSAEALGWQAAGLHCSANERRADEASRDVEAWLKCKYMREHLGEEFVGVISAVTSFGLFVTLDNLYVEGLVHITELGGEYFRYDEARQELRGERTGIRHALGSRLNVQVSRVDLDGRRIDFRLVTGDESARRPPRETREPRERGVGKAANPGQEPGDAAAAVAADPAPRKAKRTRAAATPEAQYAPKRTRKAVREVPRAAGTPAASATRGAGKTKKGKR